MERYKVYLSGFFFLDIDETKLDDKLENFMEAGEKPIIVSFSSMPLKKTKVFKDKLIEAEKGVENAVKYIEKVYKTF